MFEIKKAERKNIPALISLWGPSGSGKTFSALQVARGLVGPKGKIGVIDTENRRSETYSDQVGGWDHLDLQPPFTPQRYIEALKAFEDAGGYGCIIIDSASHIWEGEGGVLDMAENAKTAKGYQLQGLAKWRAPKTEHKKALNYMLRAPFHIIFCFRAKELSKQVGKGKDAEIVSMGLTPICGDKMIYEMMISCLLGQDHKPFFPDQSPDILVNPLTRPLKAPEGLKHIFQKGEYLSLETGKQIAAYLAGGVYADKNLARLQGEARDVASMGGERLQQYWKTLDDDQREALKPIGVELRALAEEADTQDEEHASENDDPLGAE